MKPRVTPELITQLQPDEIFVYGANESGRHGAGAAREALQWGAIYGEFGPNGQTYGIATKDFKLKTLSKLRIAKNVLQFLTYSQVYPEDKFLVTAIGCGLAGYTASDIAPMFQQGITFNNIYLPKSFWDILI